MAGGTGAAVGFILPELAPKEASGCDTKLGSSTAQCDSLLQVVARTRGRLHVGASTRTGCPTKTGPVFHSRAWHMASEQTGCTLERTPGEGLSGEGLQGSPPGSQAAQGVPPRLRRAGHSTRRPRTGL